MKKFLSRYHSSLVASLVYMLQASEYDLGEYLAWFWRAPDLRRVANRQRLVPTAKARLLLLTGSALVLLAAILAAIGVFFGFGLRQPAWFILSAAAILASPLIVAYGLVAVLWLGKVLVQNPKERAIVARAALMLQSQSGLRIGIAGSFGKTTFKENLLTVLAEGKKVAATPGNMNTPLGISRFIERLKGDEEVLIFELGEYYPGDVARLCELVRPQLGVITGVNEAHLSKFKTLEATTAAIFELDTYLKGQSVYKNGESQLVRKQVRPGDPLTYTQGGVNGWHVHDVTIGLDGTSFVAKKGNKAIRASSGLLGRHQIGPLVAVIDIADQTGLTLSQIEAGIAATKPFDHRMQPRRLAGAWVVDDTYNGNSDGVKAGLEWLAAVPARRRLYVTPGLVEQGAKTREVHETIGRLAAGIADVVVLVSNSTTPHIEQGLREAGFTGELKIIDHPVKFYSNIDQFVAAGDVVLMQNDWTDNYQ